MNEPLAEIRVPHSLGGHLALDFVNTVDYYTREKSHDYFTTYPRLIAWCWRSGLLSDDEADKLYTESQRRPEEAQDAVHFAQEVRATFYQLFAGIRARKPLEQAAVEPLNALLMRFLPDHRLIVADGKCHWSWTKSGSDLKVVLGPVVFAAAELLTSDKLELLRDCPRCGWLFLDTSRNQRRRWCSMQLCGNKIKSRRQYERRVQQAAHD